MNFLNGITTNMIEKQHRKKAREAVLQALYARHVANEDDKKVLHDINARYQFDKPTKIFVNELFNSTIKNQTILDKKIESSLENWTLERVNIIDRLIMQI